MPWAVLGNPLPRLACLGSRMQLRDLQAVSCSERGQQGVSTEKTPQGPKREGRR